MRRMLRGVPGALALLVLPHAAAAHGITVVLERQGDVVIAVCRYDGGIPVRGADVVIRAPGEDGPFQTGRTDAAGRFAFVPAAAGEWQVTVDDGVGHRRSARITVTDAALAAADAHAAAGADDGSTPDASAGDGVPGADAGAASRPAGSPAGDDSRTWRLLTGLGLLVGVTGFGYGYSARSRGQPHGG